VRDKTAKKGSSRPGAVPAIVLGTGLTALGVVRCLGRKRIPAYCISEDLEMESHSRWCREMTTRVGPLDDVAGLVSCLNLLPFDRAVLFPCSDHWTLEVLRLPHRLRTRFPSSASSAEVNRRFVEKMRFMDLLREAGVPHPRSAPVESPDDVSALTREWGGRVFLKPSNSQLFHRRFGEKAILVSSVDDAIARFRIAHEEGLGFILQEYIPGDASAHHFIDGFVNRDHEVITCFARRRLRMHPADFGNSSCMVSEDPGQVEPAIEVLKTIFKTAGYSGIFSAEFKFDERDGFFKILEVNCRPWWYIEFAARCGIDVVEMAYCDALEQPVSAPRSYDVGVSFVYPYYDYQAIKNLPREIRPGIFKWLGTVVRSKQPVAAWDDPVPWIAGIGSLLSRRLNYWLRATETSRK